MTAMSTARGRDTQQVIGAHASCLQCSGMMLDGDSNKREVQKVCVAELRVGDSNRREVQKVYYS
jgi:hypothetical protein